MAKGVFPEILSSIGPEIDFLKSNKIWEKNFWMRCNSHLLKKKNQKEIVHSAFALVPLLGFQFEFEFFSHFFSLLLTRLTGEFHIPSTTW